MSSTPSPPSQRARIGMLVLFFMLLFILCGVLGWDQSTFDYVVGEVVCWFAGDEIQDEFDEACTNLIPTSEPVSPPNPISYNVACGPGYQLLISIEYRRPWTGEVELRIYGRTSAYSAEATIIPDAAQPSRFEFVLAQGPQEDVISDLDIILWQPDRMGGREEAIEAILGVNIPACAPPLVVDAEAPSAPTPTFTPNPDGAPAIINSFCVGGKSKQLMIVFEFEQDVTGQYAAFVADMPYQLAPVPDQPKRLFFFGTPFPGGGKPAIVLFSLPDQVIVLAENDYSVVQCDFSSPSNSGGGDDYVVPSPGPGE